MSRVLEGKSICGGIVIGKIWYYRKQENRVRGRIVEDSDAEILRYESACERAGRQLDALCKRTFDEAGAEEAGIFEAQKMILKDEEFEESVKRIISGRSVNAEAAVAAAADTFAAMFANMEDAYFRARSVDVRDVSERLLRILGEYDGDVERVTVSFKGSAEGVRTSDDRGTEGATAAEGMAAQWAKVSDKMEEALSEEMSEAACREPVIIMAEDLTPSETMQFDKTFLLGFVTKKGTADSHTAIIARTLNIPALADIDISEELDGKLVIVDGFAGKLIAEPDEEMLAFYQKRIAQEQEKNALLQQYKGKETINRFGRRVHLYANIGDISDMDSVLENDAEGIGLFRSEFLYLKEKEYPSEEAMFRVYKQAAEVMKGKKVVIRTLDIGADKKADYFGLHEEENPALGYRAIRICLTKEEIFRTQLRAIIRASAYGNISILYPLITSQWEVCRIRQIVEEIKRELEEADIRYGRFEQGIMIETPAAAIISDILAKEVDFFSIGTNDLSQYTLAADRQNPELEAFFDIYHEAIMRLIRMTVENGHNAGIPVGICGEMAADATLVDTFMEMGVDELSVAPGKVLVIRKAIIG